MKREAQLPNPTAEAVKLWLKSLDRESLHGEGWIAANKRFNGITRSLRPYINQHYADPKEQEAAFDGATLALLAMAHFEDIHFLAKSLGSKIVQDESVAL